MPEEPFALTLQAPQPMAGDYDAIHAAVMETARGRWFLQEFARRNRNADTTLLLAAIERIEAALRIQTAIPASSHLASLPLEVDRAAGQDRSPGPGPSAASPAHQLHELRDAIVLTKESLPATGPDGRIALHGADFSRIAAGIERVAARVRSAAEHTQETAWSLRERAQGQAGPEREALEARCGELDAQAREFSNSCAELDGLVAGATLMAALLAEIEAQLDGVIGALQAQPDAPADRVAAESPSAMPRPDEPRTPPAVAPSLPPEDMSPVVAQESQPQPVAAPLAIMPEPVADIVTEAVVEAAAPQPQPDQTITPPQAAAAPGSTSWLDLLAPPVRSRSAPDPAPQPAVSFQLEGEAQPAIELPNPAMRETDMPVSDPVPQQPDHPQAAPQIEPEIAQAEPREAVLAIYQEVLIVAEQIAESASDPSADIAPFPANKISDDPAAFLFEPAPEARQPEAAEPEAAQPPAPLPLPPAAVNGGAGHPRPAFQPIQIGKPGDPLAPIIALSDEEKIALFS